jgi:APA family basic amino acid/polyamine antiporter
MGTLFAFILVSIGVWVLRRTQPDVPRPFRCPAVQVVVPLAVLLCGYLIANLPVETLTFFGIWYVIGMIVYFTYSRKHSTLNSQPADVSQDE